MKEIYFIIIFLSMKKIPGKNENLWREDLEGRAIYRNAYENSESEYGWSIEKIDNKDMALSYQTINEKGENIL